MTAISIKNYSKLIPKVDIKSSAKCVVREFDRIEDSKFEAYIDEGSQSFDVKIQLDKEGNVIQTSCDCASKIGFCSHKIALLKHLSSLQKDALKRTKKTKADAYSILEDVQFAELKRWVETILRNNKELELSFINNFTVRKASYSIKEIDKLINDSLKAVGCTRRKADATQLKKLLQLWEEVLQPIINNFLSDPSSQTAFDGVGRIIDQCIGIRNSLHSGGSKLNPFLQNILNQIRAELLTDLKLSKWSEAIDLLISNLKNDNSTLKLYLVELLFALIPDLHAPRKNELEEKLLHQYKDLTKIDPDYLNIYSKYLFATLSNGGTVEKHIHLFKPIQFDNNFNYKLILKLVELNDLQLAEKYCNEQIAGNYYQEYNISYLQLLEKIYTIQQNEAKLIETVKTLFPFSFNFDDYVRVSLSMNPEVHKSWRSKMLSKARLLARTNKNAADFCFRLMKYEMKYSKMLEYVNNNTPLETIMTYFNELFEADPRILLSNLLNRDSHWSENKQSDYLYPELLELILSKYSEKDIKSAIDAIKSNRYRIGSGSFLVFIQQQKNL